MQTSVIVQPRHLAAYVHADMVGYSRLVGQDDTGTFARLIQVRTRLIDPALTRYGGTIVNTAGDSLMMEFASVFSALRFAVEIQTRIPELDQGIPADQRIRFRMGVHVGDAIGNGERLVGESVNIAARLQAICPPGDVCVSDVVRQHAKELDLEFTPLGKVHLKNIERPIDAFVVHLHRAPRRGSRKILMIAAMVGGLAAGFGGFWVATRTTPRPFVDNETFSIAVLPFTNLGNDRNDDYLGDGIAEDLTTDLSHLDGAVVVARESAFTYRGKEVDIRDVGRQLGVRYVLEGSVRKLGDTLRINAQLIQANTGTHVWADRFDQSMGDLRDGQDVIVQRIGAAVNHRFEKKQQPARPTTPDAYDLILRAKVTLQEPRSDARNVIAAGYYEQALRLDPLSYEAQAGVAAMIIENRQPLKRAADLINQASFINPDAPDVLGAEFRLAVIQERPERALDTYKRLLDVDSNAANLAAEFLLCDTCTIRIFRPEELYPLLDRTVRLNPLSPDLAVLCYVLGRMAILLGRDNEAVDWLERALHEEKPDNLYVENTKLSLAAAKALTGQLDAAHQLVTSALASPKAMDTTVRTFTSFALPVYYDAHRRDQYAHLAQGLRLAGLREHLDERADSHVAPINRIQGDPNRPTPMTVSGATTIVTEDLVELLKTKPLVLTTTAQNPTIPGAILIEGDVLAASSLNDVWQGALQVFMDRISNGDKHQPIVAFAWCINRWHARNLALRLVALGYTNVYWYRGGWEAWDAHNLPMAPLTVQFVAPR
jgi:TolB-like protein/class 3 adenylate cyclase/rhodanese-related sulfurtransferase